MKHKKLHTENAKKIYIVLSYTGTLPGKLIVFRATLKFWNRYSGDAYSHISLAKDVTLTEMYSFARKTLHNPFNAGFIKESIYEGMFKMNATTSKIAVFEIPVTEEKYNMIWHTVDKCWEKRDILKFNYLGLFVQLLLGRGAARKNHYFCSQWVAAVLSACGINFFEKNVIHVRPFDFYDVLKDRLVYEGEVTKYSNRINEMEEREVCNART